MKLKKIQAVIFDWAGTTIDYGCRAPLKVLLEIFNKKGIDLTLEEASKPMGLMKIDHFREIFKMQRIQNQYLKKYNRLPDDKTIYEFYSEFEPSLFKILPLYSEPIPGVCETIDILRKKYKLKIGSTTGYTKEMMNYISPVAEKKGYKPDYVITSSETKQGRPYPWMIYSNALNLEVFPIDHIVKVGDTEVDILEAKNAGTWSVGVVEGSSLLGYNLEEFKLANQATIKEKKEKVIKTYKKLNSDFIINSIIDLPEVIDKINEKLNENEFPGNRFQVPRQPYLLFTPGPILTSNKVKLSMMTDWGSREDDYLNLIQNIRKELVKIALLGNHKYFEKDYTSIIIQGSGTYGVESCIGSAIGKNDKLLIIINGQYGERMKNIANILNISYISIEFDEDKVPDVNLIDNILRENKDVTHVGVIHSETTTGILNPLEEISEVVKKHNKLLIVDAMSSFGGVPIDMKELNIDYLISSSNKNLEGLPGISFIIARRDLMDKLKENKPKSLSLDLYDQWNYFETNNGGFRFTSPVHILKSFDEALKELNCEGGVYFRNKRYCELQKLLCIGMKKMNFIPLDLGKYQGPIITTFLTPKSKDYNFKKFYNLLKEKECIIYPGKLSKVDSFRIGTIGHIKEKEILFLLEKIEESIFWDNTLNNYLL
jgi:2-aminoethylphosphonate--pyruvate transaminase/phosphonoacetaldehyde hydrolase